MDAWELIKYELKRSALAGVSLAMLSISSCGAERPSESYPLDELGCYTLEHVSPAGEGSSCCVEARCYEPPWAEPCPTSGLDRYLPEYPPGSGDCVCGETTGPYAPNPDDTPIGDGACCYLVGSHWCTGRALVIGGLARRAPVVSRSDWLVG